jgi:hypothetical protein
VQAVAPARRTRDGQRGNRHLGAGSQRDAGRLLAAGQDHHAAAGQRDIEAGGQRHVMQGARHDGEAVGIHGPVGVEVVVLAQ